MAKTTATTIGIISDTHGLLRPEAVGALRGCDFIIHAGDVGDRSVLDGLEKVPLTVVRGNIDNKGWAKNLPDEDVLKVGKLKIYVIHHLKKWRLIH